jgi:hypothetical protein
MKNFLSAFFSIFLIISSSVSAAEPASPFSSTNEAGCGVIYSTNGDTSSPLAIENNNMTICEDDLAFTVFYLLFGDLLKSDLAQSSMSIFVDVSDKTKSLNQIAGLGTSIVSLFEGLSSLVFFIGGIWIMWQTGKYVYVTQTNGQFLGNRDPNNKKAMSIAMQGMSAIFLISPVGSSILMIQLILLLMSIFAIMLANYFLSSFLHHSYVKTTEVEIEKASLMDSSNLFANSLTAISLCEARTANAILNKNIMPGSAFVTESPNSEWDIEVEELLENIHECTIKYFAQPKESKNTKNQLGFIQILQKNFQNCDEQDAVSQIERFPDSVGYSHVCGEISYEWTDMYDLSDRTSLSGEEQATDFIVDALDNKAFKNTFSAEEYYNKFYPSAKTKISNVINDDSLSTKEKNKELFDYYIEQGEHYYGAFESNSLLKVDNFEDVKNQKLRLDLVATTHIIAINHLLGAYIQKDALLKEAYDLYKKYSLVGLVLPELFLENSADYNYYLDDPVFGFDAFRLKSAKPASKSLISSNCAKNWKDLYDSRKFFKYFEGVDKSSMSADEFVESGNIDFECFAFDKEKKTFEYLLPNDAYTFKDYDESQRLMGVIDDNQKYMHDIEAPRYKREAKIEMEAMKGYNFAMKYAISKSLAEKLKDSSDTSLLVTARQRGWASLGSLMLEISNSQGNARKYVQTITNTAAVNSPSSHNGTSIQFYNDGAFKDGFNRDSVKLKAMTVADVFSPTAGLTLNKDSAEVSESSFLFDIWNKVETTIRNWMFSPIIYIQKGSGMNTNDTLVEGLEECAKNNDCVPSESHPINTLMMFGQDLISKVVTIMLIGQIADMIASVTDIDTKKKNDVSENSIMTKIVGLAGGWVLTIIHHIAAGLAALIGSLDGVFMSLLFVGVLCAYLIPTIPYITFSIVFLNWLINIFVVLFTAPILILLMARIDENGNNQITFARLWQSFGSVLLKPALITIAMIFAWTLSSVSLFFINSTIYPLFLSIGDSGFLIFDLLSTAAIYIVYISTIVIVVKHSFSVIASFADDFLSIIGVRGTGDSNIVQSMNLERLLVAGKMAEGIHKGTSNASNVARGTTKAARGTAKFANKMGKKIKDKLKKPEGEASSEVKPK